MIAPTGQALEACALGGAPAMISDW